MHLINHIDKILNMYTQLFIILRIRNDDEATETNFQKAGTTLDASVKIYGCRVDDTLNTGYRILESLNRGEQSKQADVSGDVEEETSKQIKKGSNVSTIESNKRSLELDASETAFEADPLFHLMSRRFDEGGVKGLLLSNLVLWIVSEK